MNIYVVNTETILTVVMVVLMLGILFSKSTRGPHDPRTHRTRSPRD